VKANVIPAHSGAGAFQEVSLATTQSNKNVRRPVSLQTGRNASGATVGGRSTEVTGETLLPAAARQAGDSELSIR